MKHEECPGVYHKSFSQETKKTTPQWPGTYRDELGKTLVILESPGLTADLQFNLKQESANCHEGFKGHATILSATTASYKRDEQTVTFTLKTGQIEISEQGYEHGVNCESFSGIYIKQ